jgi:hypothetical protein
MQVNDEIPPLKFDERIICMHQNPNGEIWGSFNCRKPTCIKLTKKQFEMYKPFCNPPKRMTAGEHEFDFYGVIHDSGMPNWFKWF